MADIQKIIELFNEIENTHRKKEKNFEEIQDIVKSILEKKGMNERTNKKVFAGELKIIYNAVITANPMLKDWVKEFLLINYENESGYFINKDSDDEGDYEGADYGGKRKSRKFKKFYSKKGKFYSKKRKFYSKKRKSRKTKKY
uniref:Uncharacterized protein n=1 Tax=viral metagenome TaxID=1070528 RepID=A0A6C0IER3_9ZZZZ